MRSNRRIFSGVWMFISFFHTTLTLRINPEHERQLRFFYLKIPILTLTHSHSEGDTYIGNDTISSLTDPIKSQIEFGINRLPY